MTNNTANTSAHTTANTSSAAVAPVEPTIASAFADRKALIGFLTAGDPNLATTRDIVLGMAESGCDLIELGIPFSDPVAEGPVIQEASLRALANGITMDQIFDMVAEVREKSNVPLVFMGYMNPLLRYGMEKFFARCAELGIAGIILADISHEESHEVRDVADKYGVAFISMLAPTSTKRVSLIAPGSKGFIYLVSSLGVTGVRSEIKTNAAKIVEQVREYTDTPVAIGFGISTPEQAHDMAEVADGAIIGSAIMEIVAEHGENAVEPVKQYIAELRAGLDQ